MNIQKTVFNDEVAYEIIQGNKQLFQVVFETIKQAETYIKNLTPQQLTNIKVGEHTER